MHDNSATMNPCITPGPTAHAPGTAGVTPAAAWARPLFTAALWASLALGTSAMAQPAAKPRMADYIVAVVNQESVTAFEVRQRAQRLRAEAQRTGAPLPPGDQLEREVLDSLIDERAILSQAREGGIRVDDGDMDRALANIAAQNQISVVTLRDRMVAEGMDFNRFRATVREQIIVERMREREVSQRVRITDTEVEDYIEKQRGQRAGEVEYNIAQVLIPVPEGASAAVLSERRALADAAMARVRAGEDFAAVAKALSQDANRERGGEIGLRPADRLPDLFLETVRPLAAGAVAPSVVRSGAGFHILKLIERRDGAAFRVTQTRARHILLRVNDASNRDAAIRQMREWRTQIERGTRRFEDIARERSEDGTASSGGDLGWASPGQFVPEFEQAMNPLPPGGLSEPVVSRFGVHLIQVVERRETALDNKQLRDQARAALREQKFEEAYGEWIKEMRSRAYVERREAPQI
ncbi:MAG: peptidylprolyl isomerase [Betaproteobacteria bacterium]